MKYNLEMDLLCSLKGRNKMAQLLKGDNKNRNLEYLLTKKRSAIKN